MAWLERKMVVVAASVVVLALAAPAMAKKGGGGGGGKGGKSTPAPTAPTPTPPTDSSAQITSDVNDVTAARTALTQATKDLDDATAKLVAENEATAEFVAAKKAADDAAAAVGSAKAAILGRLGDDPAYESKVAGQAAAQAGVETLRANGADKDAIADKATEAFNLANAIGKMERDALSADAGYKDADAKSIAASTVVAGLRSKFKESLKTDERLAVVRQARDDAQSKLTAAQAKLVADRGF